MSGLIFKVFLFFGLYITIIYIHKLYRHSQKIELIDKFTPLKSIDRHRQTLHDDQYLNKIRLTTDIFGYYRTINFKIFDSF